MHQLHERITERISCALRTTIKLARCRLSFLGHKPPLCSVSKLLMLTQIDGFRFHSYSAVHDGRSHVQGSTERSLLYGIGRPVLKLKSSSETAGGIDDAVKNVCNLGRGTNSSDDFGA